MNPVPTLSPSLPLNSPLHSPPNADTNPLAVSPVLNAKSATTTTHANNDLSYSPSSLKEKGTNFNV